MAGTLSVTAQSPNATRILDRRRMVRLAAYSLAERSGFRGDPRDYWMAAEAQIDRQLGL